MLRFNFEAHNIKGNAPLTYYNRMIKNKRKAIITKIKEELNKEL